MNDAPFHLHRSQWPDPPCATAWSDWLRWLLMVLDGEDLAVPLIAKFLWDLSQNDCLSKGQAEFAEYTINRVFDAMVDRDVPAFKSRLRLVVDNTLGGASE